MKTMLKVLFALVVLGTLSACASSRSVVTPEVIAGANPTEGVAVRIDKVEDARRFEASPPSPDIPSLSGNDHTNVAVTKRAIARKRNGYGMAMGDVLLPEGQNVAELVGKAVAQGFRQAGYRVIAPGEPGYEQAAPVNARIGEFWSWFNPGFASVTVSNRSSVDLIGTLPELNGGRTVKSEVSESMMAVFEDDWKAIVAKGLRQLSTKVAETLKAR